MLQWLYYKLCIETMENNNIKPIAGAIIIAGVLIAGAILLKDSSGSGVSAPISKQVGLSVKKFNACLESGKFKDKVQADVDDGVVAGVSGTPSSFILKDGQTVSFTTEDGKEYDSIPGAQPYEIVMKNINRILGSEVESKETKIRPVSAEDHVVGDLNTAKLVVVEYSDLECPFCKSFHATMHQVVEKSNGDVAWVYRHYPIPQLHPKALRAAEATECAWEQGGNKAFWKYADKVFEIGLQTNTF
ncbi:MAG: thioredoxin domain-containing protein [Minisyncoccia bacterium]